MPALLHLIARYVVQKGASDPVVREVVVKVARGVVDETKQIVREDNRAYAAGRALRRAFDGLQSDRKQIAKKDDRAYAAGRALRRALDKLQSTDSEAGGPQIRREQDVPFPSEKPNAVIQHKSR